MNNKIILALASLLVLAGCSGQKKSETPSYTEAFKAVQNPGPGQDYVSCRPAPADRLFVSKVIDDKIAEVQALLTNPKLRWMFGNCFANTLDTTVHFGKDKDGNFRTFVYTGDIPAMWLRDSGAQVWPYVEFAAQDENLRDMIAGVINCQFSLINIDPYANAFNDGPTGAGAQTDETEMRPEVFERKWEIDSQCYPVRLAYRYWKVTGDTSVFGDVWLKAIRNILDTFETQQRKDGFGPYTFARVTDRQLDTKACGGKGQPAKPCGLIASSFRPSDDATQFEFLVPSNFFAVSILRKASEILSSVNHEDAMAAEATALADEVSEALRRHAVVDDPDFGPVYAFEVDGYGNHYLMDDANVPSLLALPYLDAIDPSDPVWQNTRRLVWSERNPFFFKGKAAEGIGGPHIGYDMVWPMSLIMKAFTSDDPEEIRACIQSVVDNDGGTGFIHESFNKDDPTDYTRSWFAWANTLFGELILHQVEAGRLDMLNSIR